LTNNDETIETTLFWS